MYESYLRKDGENREIVMGEIGSEKHIIAGYVGVGSQVRRIPALGRIDHLRVDAESVKVYSRTESSKSEITGIVIEKDTDSSDELSSYFYVYNSVKTDLYGRIAVYIQDSSTITNAAFCEVRVYMAYTEIDFFFNLTAVYADGHELSLSKLYEIVKCSFSNSAAYMYGSVYSTSVITGMEEIYTPLDNLIFRNVNKIDGYDNFNASFNNARSIDYTDGKFLISTWVNSSTLDSDGQWLARVSTALYTEIEYNYEMQYNLDQDGNIVPFLEISAPASWGGVKYIFAFFVWRCVCCGI